MFTVTYYKIAGRWYLDNPDYLEKGGNPDNLERIGVVYDLLEQAAQGRSSVQLVLDTKPFEGAEEAVLIESSGAHTGAHYLLHSISGQRVDLEIWINELIYHYHDELPPTIYGKFM
jgi:hypothetical protein